MNEVSTILTGRTMLVTGGSGSFGHAMVERALRSEVREIRIYSRDEKKQEDMRHQFRDGRWVLIRQPNPALIIAPAEVTP